MQRSLVERAAAGDQRAFEALVRGSAYGLFAIAYQIVRDHHRAEDALQQTLVTIWDELPRLRDPARSKARRTSTRSLTATGSSEGCSA